MKLFNLIGEVLLVCGVALGAVFCFLNKECVHGIQLCALTIILTKVLKD